MQLTYKKLCQKLKLRIDLKNEAIRLSKNEAKKTPPGDLTVLRQTKYYKDHRTE
jgi:hypothetical protein